MSDVPHEPSSHEDAPDDPYAVAFELILAAGSARSTAMEAICVVSLPGLTATFQPAGALAVKE